MSELPVEAPALIKRTTLIVRDMTASRRWYEQVLGMQVWMDTEFVLSGEGLAAGAEGDRTHLVIMRGEHDKIGMIGLLQWLDPPWPAPPVPTEVAYGAPVFVVECDDAERLAARAAALGTRVHCPPRIWSTRGARGELRHFIGTSVFDPDGHFYECNQVTAIEAFSSPQNDAPPVPKGKPARSGSVSTCSIEAPEDAS